MSRQNAKTQDIIFETKTPLPPRRKVYINMYIRDNPKMCWRYSDVDNIIKIHQQFRSFFRIGNHVPSRSYTSHIYIYIYICVSIYMCIEKRSPPNLSCDEWWRGYEVNRNTKVSGTMVTGTKSVVFKRQVKYEIDKRCADGIEQEIVRLELVPFGLFSKQPYIDLYQ